MCRGRRRAEIRDSDGLPGLEVSAKETKRKEAGRGREDRNSVLFYFPALLHSAHVTSDGQTDRKILFSLVGIKAKSFVFVPFLFCF